MAIREYIDLRGASYTIPPKSDVADSWPVDWYIYKERHWIECFFQKLKWFCEVEVVQTCGIFKQGLKE